MHHKQDGRQHAQHLAFLLLSETQVCLLTKKKYRKDVPVVTHLVAAYVQKKSNLTQVCLLTKKKYRKDVPVVTHLVAAYVQKKSHFLVHSNGFLMASPESPQAHQPSHKNKKYIGHNWKSLSPRKTSSVQKKCLTPSKDNSKYDKERHPLSIEIQFNQIKLETGAAPKKRYYKKRYKSGYSKVNNFSIQTFPISYSGTFSETEKQEQPRKHFPSEKSKDSTARKLEHCRNEGIEARFTQVKLQSECKVRQSESPRERFFKSKYVKVNTQASTFSAIEKQEQPRTPQERISSEKSEDSTARKLGHCRNEDDELSFRLPNLDGAMSKKKWYKSKSNLSKFSHSKINRKSTNPNILDTTTFSETEKKEQPSKGVTTEQLEDAIAEALKNCGLDGCGNKVAEDPIIQVYLGKGAIPKKKLFRIRNDLNKLAINKISHLYMNRNISCSTTSFKSEEQEKLLESVPEHSEDAIVQSLKSIIFDTRFI
ncbi:hypothetical protein CDAR_386011 [Caerostris darwini]|uniref:Uncharacterized protein n=1 Tax=Caerostris darwini TaxID=1538125 RepID=A0AAV4VQB1_9ARAC|nr:hypothetical protein CDAR_386011 [Caerostris darwini]